MNEAMAGYNAFIGVVRYALFGLAVLAAIVALVDWAVRTRHINPFNPVARFFRRVVDPMMAPVERRIVRRGGMPSNAPWWTLVIIVVGGILLIYVLELLGRLFIEAMWGMSSPVRFGVLLITWTFSILRIALIVRVISTWLSISPYSPWIRWSYVLTEWMLAPLRKVIPMIGPVDITPIVAYFALAVLQGIIL